MNLAHLTPDQRLEYLILSASRGHKFLDALSHLGNRPVIAETLYQWSHFDVRPFMRKIVAVERVRHHLTLDDPARHARVVIAQFV